MEQVEQSEAGDGKGALPTIHTMWVGARLSRLELLTLVSFAAKGHPVVLWAYEDIQTPLPAFVSLADAEQIFPRKKIRAKQNAEPAIGIGTGSLGGVFSDLFRYRVLFEQGGIWSDMDVTALQPLDFTAEYFFRPHKLGMVGTIMKCPRGSPLMRAVYEATEPIASELTPWLLPIEILNEHVRAQDLGRFIVPNLSNRDKWAEVRQFVEFDKPFQSRWYAFHWMNERWRSLLQDQEDKGVTRARFHSKDSPPPGSTLDQLYRTYGIGICSRTARGKP